MIADNTWFSRKRKNQASDSTGSRNSVIMKSRQQSSSPRDSSMPSSSSSSLSSIPSSLLPHLGWTRLSSTCPISSKGTKRRSDWNRNGRNDTGKVRKVEGKAVFFFHDPRNESRFNESQVENHMTRRLHGFKVGSSRRQRRRNNPTL